MIPEHMQRTLGRKKTLLIMNAVNKYEQRQTEDLRVNRVKSLYQTMRGVVQSRIERQRTNPDGKHANIKDLELF